MQWTLKALTTIRCRTCLNEWIRCNDCSFRNQPYTLESVFLLCTSQVATENRLVLLVLRMIFQIQYLSFRIWFVEQLVAQIWMQITKFLPDTRDITLTQRILRSVVWYWYCAICRVSDARRIDKPSAAEPFLSLWFTRKDDFCCAHPIYVNSHASHGNPGAKIQVGLPKSLRSRESHYLYDEAQRIVMCTSTST